MKEKVINFVVGIILFVFVSVMLWFGSAVSMGRFCFFYGIDHTRIIDLIMFSICEFLFIARLVMEFVNKKKK